MRQKVDCHYTNAGYSRNLQCLALLKYFTNLIIIDQEAGRLVLGSICLSVCPSVCPSVSQCSKSKSEQNWTPRWTKDEYFTEGSQACKLLIVLLIILVAIFLGIRSQLTMFFQLQLIKIALTPPPPPLSQLWFYVFSILTRPYPPPPPY